MLSSVMFAFFWILLLSCTIIFTYRALKLQRGDADAVKRFLYWKDKDGVEKPIVIGHRAGQFEAAENTLIAIRTAHGNGATAVELDLEFTKDQHAVILHDDTVDRTTNGTGAVSELTFEKLRTLDAAAKSKTLRLKDGSVKEAGFEQIPTLQEVAKLCIELKMKIILDVKSNAQLTARALSKLSKEFSKVQDHVFVTSFYPNILYTVKSACSEYHTALIWRPDYVSLTINHKPRFTGLVYILMQFLDMFGEFSVHSWLPDFLGIGAVSMHKDHLSWRYVDQWRSKGVQLMAWTVNNPLEKEYCLKRYKIPIITDSILNKEDLPEQEF